MKLFLSSLGFGRRPRALTELGGDNKKVAVVMSAIDAQPAAIRKERTKAECVALRSIGLEPEEIDLRNYFGKSAALESCMEKFGYIWTAGGNTFTLRRAFALSGFDRILCDWRGRTDLVYSGYSAGACVVTPTLRGIEFADSPHQQPEGYTGDLVWEGLGFVPYSIIPHYQEKYPAGSPRDNEVNFLIQNKIPFIVLKDSEVIIEEIQ